MIIRKLTTLIVAGVIAAPFAYAQSTNVSMDDLLEQVRQGRAMDNAENQRRLENFANNRAQQQQLIQQITAERRAEEARSAQLEDQFQVNDERLIEMEAALEERLGDLKELFGVVQQAAGDARGEFEGSVTNVQFPDRGEFMTELAVKMGQTNRFASLEEIERLWFELQREMTESGKVVDFNADVITAAGGVENKAVTRVGVFTTMAGGKYLNYDPQTQNLSELARQPQSRYLKGPEELEGAASGLVPVAIDPARGQLLKNLVKKPSLVERMHQGKEVGYVIIALGIIALLVAIWRLIALSGISAAVNKQVKNLDKPGNNPLGRVLSVYQANKTTDSDTMELKLGEAILKELPALNKMLAFLKIIAVVAPLMGLLGTVTGMIVTFQQIQLLGTGNPSVMAGGISQALVTTVLGLLVAIPTVFLHALVSSRAKHVSEVLQQQAAGMVAEQAAAN